MDFKDFELLSRYLISQCVSLAGVLKLGVEGTQGPR